MLHTWAKFLSNDDALSCRLFALYGHHGYRLRTKSKINPSKPNSGDPCFSGLDGLRWVQRHGSHAECTHLHVIQC
jgi:hypothetical protein